MSLLDPAPDFIMGNTRLRARRPALLTPDRLAGLAGRDLPGLVADLRATAYGPHLPADSRGSAPSAEPTRTAVIAAIGNRRREALRGVRAVYTGRAGEVIGVLLAGYDLADTLTLLRGAAHDLPDE